MIGLIVHIHLTSEELDRLERASKARKDTLNEYVEHVVKDKLREWR